MSYRSTDKKFMDKIKKNVLAVTKHQEKETRKYALNYLRNHIKIDDLHKRAIKEFPGRVIVFGEGPYCPDLVIVTKNPIKQEQKEKLEKAWNKLRIPKEKIYYAHIRFVSTKKKQLIRQEIVEKLIDFLSPKAVLLFDDVSVKAKSEILSISHPIQTLVDPDKSEERKDITKKLKEVRSIILR